MQEEDTSNISCDEVILQAEKTLWRKLFRKTLLEELLCPVCLTHIQPPILMCELGHNFCEKCKIKLKECPICKKSLTTIRNINLEALSNLISYPCPNSSEGCRATIPHTLLEVHCRVSCRGRPLKCPYHFLGECNALILRSSMKKHITDYHKGVYYQDTNNTFLQLRWNSTSVPDGNYTCTTLFISEEIFFLVWLDYPCCTVAALLFLGNEKKAAEYKYRIIVLKNEIKAVVGTCMPASYESNFTRILKDCRICGFLKSRERNLGLTYHIGPFLKTLFYTLNPRKKFIQGCIKGTSKDNKQRETRWLLEVVPVNGDFSTFTEKLTNHKSV